MNVVPLKKPETARLHCSACGVTVDAACDCGAPYVSAGQVAAKAIKAHPTKSDRAIAADYGISHTTVQNARRATGNNLPVEDGEKRTGRDGKVRKLPIRNTSKAVVVKDDDRMPTQEEADEEYQLTLYDHACLIVDEKMSGETRRKFFAHLMRKYHGLRQDATQVRSKGLPA